MYIHSMIAKNKLTTCYLKSSSSTNKYSPHLPLGWLYLSVVAMTKRRKTTGDIAHCSFGDHKASFKDKCASSLELELSVFCFLSMLIMRFLSGPPWTGSSTLLHDFDVFWIITSHTCICSWTMYFSTVKRMKTAIWKGIACVSLK